MLDLDLTEEVVLVVLVEVRALIVVPEPHFGQTESLGAKDFVAPPQPSQPERHRAHFSDSAPMG